MDNDCDEFWKRVNALIKSRKTKQEDVANSCGINYQTFRGWVVHKTYPNAKQSVLIAKALDTTVEYLVTGHYGDFTVGIRNMKQKLAELEVELHNLESTSSSKKD